MAYFYLIITILCVSFQNIIKKPFTRKTNGKGVFFFSLMTSLAAMLFFIITSKGFKWNPDLLLYALFFGVSYAAATVFSVAAIACGSLPLTTLIIQYSLMVPTLYGLIFLNDPISSGLLPGIVLLIISLFLINQKNAKSSINFKWIICVFLSFFGNGICSVSQKMQQLAFNGDYKNEFMITSLAIVLLLLSVLVVSKERKDIKIIAKAGWHTALFCGLANGIMNLFVMILSNIMPVSMMFPLISAGGIIITYLVSKFLYKEELTRKQFFGFLIGIASVVFLNI